MKSELDRSASVPSKTCRAGVQTSRCKPGDQNLGAAAIKVQTFSQHGTIHGSGREGEGRRIISKSVENFAGFSGPAETYTGFCVS
jgi:hypothetical protein